MFIPQCSLPVALTYSIILSTKLKRSSLLRTRFVIVLCGCNGDLENNDVLSEKSMCVDRSLKLAHCLGGKGWLNWLSIGLERDPMDSMT